MSTESPRAPRLNRTQWLICTMAAIGFAFDIFELLMAPLIMRPALLELTGAQPGSPEFQAWVGRLFYIPALAGGAFGLLGGYVTDRLGRRRVLTGSILLYAFSAFFAGFSTSIEMLLFFRCTTFIGVCVEFVAAVAWLAELFPDPRQREKVLGITQAFSSVGGLLVAVANGLCIAYAASLPAIGLPGFLQEWLGGTVKDAHAAWRYTLMSGLIPALPLIVIRPFLPESPVWKQKRDAGTLKRPSLAAIFAPELRRTTILTTLLFACSYGAAFGAIQQVPQIVPGLAEVQAMGEGLSVPQKKSLEQAEAASVTKVQEIGGLVGRVLLAFLVLRIASRRKLLRCFQIPGLILMPIVFAYLAVNTLDGLYVGMFLIGLVTVAQFSFWGNYLPLVYPVHLRGTGEGFAANIGGRMIGTSFAWVTSSLAATGLFAGSPPAQRVAFSAAIVGTFVYLAGLILSAWLPEPRPEQMAE
jgi:MFS family permease